MARPTITKRSVIEIKGINPYIHITASEAKTLKENWRKPLPVCVQVNGKPDTPWHINMVPAGNGDFYLYLHNDVRRAAGVRVGDTVTMIAWFDDAYHGGPQDPMPMRFSRALRANQAARAAWESLSPSRQKEILRYLHHLKSEAAQVRNLERLMHALAGESAHFMGRDWRNGK